MHGWRRSLLLALVAFAPAPAAADVLYRPEQSELRIWAFGRVASDACTPLLGCVGLDHQEAFVEDFSPGVLRVIETSAGKEGLARTFGNSSGDVLLDLEGDRLLGGSALLYTRARGKVEVPYETEGVDAQADAGAYLLLSFFVDAPATIRLHGVGFFVEPIPLFANQFDDPGLSVVLRGDETLFTYEESVLVDFDSGPIELAAGQLHTIVAGVQLSTSAIVNEDDDEFVDALFDARGDIELWFEVPEPAGGSAAAALALAGLGALAGRRPGA